jgi:hypothetical protein
VIARQQRLPILRRRVLSGFALEIELAVELLCHDGRWRLTPFLFDTGTQLTTMPVKLASEVGIPIPEHRPVVVQGATGTASGFVGPLDFSFSWLPEYQFRSTCCFTTVPLRRPLLSLNELVRHFTIRTLLPSRVHPLGSLLLRLHRKHEGTERS